MVVQRVQRKFGLLCAALLLTGALVGCGEKKEDTVEQDVSKARSSGVKPGNGSGPPMGAPPKAGATDYARPAGR